jgi:hypothetical protein
LELLREEAEAVVLGAVRREKLTADLLAKGQWQAALDHLDAVLIVNDLDHFGAIRVRIVFQTTRKVRGRLNGNAESAGHNLIAHAAIQRRERAALLGEGQLARPNLLALKGFC